jgi:hypothetical protein
MIHGASGSLRAHAATTPRPATTARAPRDFAVGGRYGQAASRSTIRPTGRRTPPPKPSPQQNFGAGIVAGASDNDPTTVATLAVIGSTTVYELCWLTLLVIPMLAIVVAGATGIYLVQTVTGAGG